MPSITFEQSGAFIERFSVPPTGEGPLAGLRFAVKDLIDIAGHRTGCGNPTWLATHPPAAVSAVCVEQLLAAGAQIEGKTITDEVAFSLIGANFFYGTPLNPAAPDRVPGGSSSGSASAVACGLVDFALGTDTGGSVRVPASNCGLWGLRTSHGKVSVAGVMPLAPTFDTVGLFAASLEILQRTAAVLLASDPPAPAVPGTIHLVAEAFALADAEIRQVLHPAVECLRDVFGQKVRETSLGEICNDSAAAELASWLDTFRALQSAEVGSCLGAWIAAEQPAFGPAPRAGFDFMKSMDRTRVGEAACRREHYCRQSQRGLGARDLLCLPTAPTFAPLKKAITYDRKDDYYRRTLSLTSIAGIGRLPQVSLPLATASSAPIGLSLIGGWGEDLHLLQVAAMIAERWAGRSD